MNIAELSIRRPVFITCLVIMMLAVGLLSLYRLPVDLFPNIEMPFIMVTVVYPGAGPEEIANLVAKPIEEEVRTISGIKNIMSYNHEGVSFIFAEFQLEADPVEAEQQMRDKVYLAKARLPKEVEEPIIQRYSFGNQPVMTMALHGGESLFALYELADRKLRPEFEQVRKVSQVKIYGGAKREIQVLLNRPKMADYELSVSQVGQALQMGGSNIPLGKRPEPQNPKREWIYRSLGEYNNLEKIKSAIVKFIGNDMPVRIADIGRVLDGHEDENSRAYFNGQANILVEVYKQSGANTVAVADAVRKRMQELNAGLLKQAGNYSLSVVRDGAKSIRDNITDVGESILIGIFLTIIVVFFFLGNLRSTLITGAALPNSLIGAFILIALAGFSVDTISLLALSLAVGLLIDDAIVVRENIFRHIELGQAPKKAALAGTQEVLLAVIATTLAVISVFGPIAFVGGITGKFLREFGLTVCFIMAISLFDALTMGPMLSAYFAGIKESQFFLVKWWTALIHPLVRLFDQFQTFLETSYQKIARGTVKRPGSVLVFMILLSIASYFTFPLLPKTFLPSADSGEFRISIELEPGASLAATTAIAQQLDRMIRANPEVKVTSLIVGGEEASEANFYVLLVPSRERSLRSSEFKNKLRQQLADFQKYKLKITEYDIFFAGERPFILKLASNDAQQLEASSERVLAAMKNYRGFVEADTSYRPGKPELRLIYDEQKSKRLGVSTGLAGAEMRAQIEGITPAKFRQGGEEWNIRVQMREQDRELKTTFPNILIPNMNYRLVNLSQVAHLVTAKGLNTVYRQNGQRMFWLSSDIAKGYGVGDLMTWIQKTMKEQKLLAPGVHYYFEGQGEQFSEMSQNIMLAGLLAVLFIYLVLASLYESFFMPFALLLPLPLAVSGALVALWLAGETLNIYSMIATIMLLGIATKNSILLIDYTNQLVKKGQELTRAIVEAGKTRLRPILMTSMALIAGTLPVAIGLNEASKQRSSMGWVIIGGVISSTLLSLVVVPATLAFFQKRKSRKSSH